MDTKKTFISSEKTLLNVVDQIKMEQWDLEVSKALSPSGGTLRTILNSLAYDDAWVPDVLEGKTIAEVGTKYDGDLLGPDPSKSMHTIFEKTIETVNNFQELNKKVHLSYGDFSAEEYLQHITLFRVMRTVGIARFIGTSEKLPDELLESVLEFVEPNAETWREVGVFGPKIEIPANADLQIKFLCLTGMGLE